MFATRLLRLFAYGFLSVIMALYLVQVGLSEQEIGLLLTLTLLGDTAVSLSITTNADRTGRKRMLIIGALLMVFASVLFAVTRNFYLLLFAATVGVISPSGNEVGPFLSIEQASLTQFIRSDQRTHVFAWYNLVGSFATASGALAAGLLSQALQNGGMSPLGSYRVVVIGYGLFGLALIVLFLRLSPAVEVAAGSRRVGTQSGAKGTVTPPSGEGAANEKVVLGLRSRSLKVVLRLAGLFSIDAFAGGFVVQSLVAYWFHVRFGVAPGLVGKHLLRRQHPGGHFRLRARRGWPDRSA